MELRCTHDPASRGGWSEDGRKVKGTLQWVSAKHGREAEVRLYDQLFSVENPNAVDEGGTFTDNLNPDSLQIISNAFVEPALAEAKAGEFVQFLRIGYFCPDAKDHSPEKPVFNRTVTLRDTWARVQRAQEKKS